MKQIITFVFLFSIILISKAQTVNYQIVEDNPEVGSRLNMNLDFAHIDFSIKMLDATSFNVGLWGYYELLPKKLYIDYNIQKSILVLGRMGNKELPGNLEINANGNFMLFSKQRKKNLKVVLKAEHRTNSVGNDYTNITYIMVPGTVLRSTGVRGGLYYKSNPYLFDSDQIANLVDYGGKMTTTGIFGGLIFKSTRNIVIKDDQFGRNFNSLGNDFYIDVMLLPIVSFSDVVKSGNGTKVDETKAIKAALGNSPFGFRIGYKGYQIAPKATTGKKFGMSYLFEAGMKPYFGWFASGGLGITILK